MITQERLKEVLRYSPLAGVFEWRIQGRRIRPGYLAGGVCRQSGYVHICIDRRTYRAHVLAWLYMTGEYRPNEIDHKDGDRSNNAFNNLRIATSEQNGWNRKLAKNNTSGIKGISFRAGKKPWEAKFDAAGKTIWLGRFETKDLAEEALIKKREEIHGEFANHGIHGYEREELQDALL
ncbi:HNH endonuclease [Pseudomonas aeruginosa]|nr:HNH endonuclease [Pseudomonas aeruginosa]